MPLAIHTIKKAKGTLKSKKRVGRGNASGHGTYSCRGLKGQKSRSGVSGLKRIGMKNIILQTPKLRGFKSKRPNNQVVNFDDINKNFKDGDSVNPKTLFKAGLINKVNLPVKILSVGELKLKKIKIENVKVSKSAQEIIDKNI